MILPLWSLKHLKESWILWFCLCQRDCPTESTLVSLIITLHMVRGIVSYFEVFGKESSEWQPQQGVLRNFNSNSHIPMLAGHKTQNALLVIILLCIFRANNSVKIYRMHWGRKWYTKSQYSISVFSRDCSSKYYAIIYKGNFHFLL